MNRVWQTRLRVKKGNKPAIMEDKLLKEGRRGRYLGDARQVHQGEVDHMRGEYLKMDRLVADPLNIDKQTKAKMNWPVIDSISNLKMFFWSNVMNTFKKDFY